MAGPSSSHHSRHRDDHSDARPTKSTHKSKDHKHSSDDERKHKRRKDRGEDELIDRDDRKKDKDRKRKHGVGDGDGDERKSGKREKRDKEKSGTTAGLSVLDDDDDEDGDGGWIEKDIDAEQSISNIPSSASLLLKSNPSTSSTHPPLPPSTAFDSTSSLTNTNSDTSIRESWMLDPTEITIPASGIHVDSSTGRTAMQHDEISGKVRSASTDIRDLGVGMGIDKGKETYMGGGMTDGFGEDENGGRTSNGDVDFFSSMGTERVKKPKEEKPDPNKLVLSKYELNTQLLEGKSVEDYTPTIKQKIVPGSAGSQWRMMKLRRVYEQAEEERKTVEEVAIERYGNLEDFTEAREERRVLDERSERRSARRGGGLGTGPNSGFNTPGGRSDSGAPGSGSGPGPNSARRFMFTTDEGTSSRSSSRAGFKRPGEDSGEILSGMGQAGSRIGNGIGMGGENSPASSSGMRTPQGRGSGKFDSKHSTPIPSVITPHQLLRNPLSSTNVPIASASDPTASIPPLTTSELNKLQAKVLRAKLTGNPKADELQADYDIQVARAASSSGGGGDSGDGLWKGGKQGVTGQLGRKETTEEEGDRREVQVLPTLDGMGRLYDVGTTDGQEDPKLGPGNRKPKEGKFETRDSKTGELLRINADDDTVTLGELVRQEKFSGGSRSQKDMDTEMALSIARDGKYKDDLDYMDENAEKLARRKMKTDAMKRAFAIQDFARTKKALDTCNFCYQEDTPPRAAIVALGQRTYLACTQNEELVDGHCMIVPLQHYMSMLELDDDDWEEVKNFMKCLMQMFAKENKGVIFFETIVTLKHQAHSYIECIPLPANEFADAPAYFRESILASESEWSTNKKLIDFSLRPGGFRRSMVPNLPYFMVQWDHKGEKGYGHIIEGVNDALGKGATDDDSTMVDESTNNAQQFPRYFAAEIIGNMLGLEPRKWRKPRRVDQKRNKERASKLGNKFQPFNWTLQLQAGGSGAA